MRKNRRRYSLIPLTLILLILSFNSTLAQGSETYWQAWEDKDITALTNDNTGATFTLSDTLLSPAGSPALEIAPGGTSEETKLVFAVRGTDLQAWDNYQQLHLEVYLPETNTLNPNRFFLGMADATGEWSWIDGVFGLAEGANGWVRVVFTPSAAMHNLNADGEYLLYFSFFFENSAGKQPLTEVFNLGSLALLSPVAEATSESSEIETLLALDDAALVEAVARTTFNYFWHEANPENGLVRDRSTPASPSSIAAVGFGLSALTIAADRGWISEADAYDRALVTLQSFTGGFVAGENGFFYHFVDMDTGQRVWESEVSSIDTALLVAGALTVSAYFPDTEAADLAQQLYENVDWTWMLNAQGFISMGWTPENGFLAASWDHFDESLLLYVLAIGSPTHPTPPDVWARWRRPVSISGEYIYLPGEPLFVYQYPLVWLDLRGREDAFAHYFNNTTRACQRNQAFTARRAERVLSYRFGVWGLSASDGPDGYRAYGASDANHDGTIAPYASAACLPFTPEAALESMRALLMYYGSQVWGEYGFFSAFNVDEDWYSRDHLGIDQGDILLMIANYQDAFVWNLIAQNEDVQNGLSAMGFVESQGDYAITPAYLAEVQGR